MGIDSAWLTYKDMEHHGFGGPYESWDDFDKKARAYSEKCRHQLYVLKCDCNTSTFRGRVRCYFGLCRNTRWVLR
jgi:hypothetical protein